MVIQDQVSALKSGLGALPEKDRGFAKSLLDQYAAKGSLSDKQAYWLGRLADAITASMTPKATYRVGSLSGIIALLETAAKKLKHPAIQLSLHGSPVTISRAGADSKNPGAIYVKMPKGIGYAGKVTAQGDFSPVNSLEEPTLGQLHNLLQRLAADPAGVASKYGKMVGRCCFCHLQLTDAKSLAVGYGKACASNYGLPWG